MRQDICLREGRLARRTGVFVGMGQISALGERTGSWTYRRSGRESTGEDPYHTVIMNITVANA